MYSAPSLLSQAEDFELIYPDRMHVILDKDCTRKPSFIDSQIHYWLSSSVRRFRQWICLKYQMIGLVWNRDSSKTAWSAINRFLQVFPSGVWTRARSIVFLVIHASSMPWLCKVRSICKCSVEVNSVHFNDQPCQPPSVNVRGLLRMLSSYRNLTWADILAPVSDIALYWENKCRWLGESVQADFYSSFDRTKADGNHPLK